MKVEEQVIPLEQAKKLKELGVTLPSDYYWVNLSAWREGYKLMPAEEAEFKSAETKWTAFTDFKDTYPAYTLEQALLITSKTPEQ